MVVVLVEVKDVGETRELVPFVLGGLLVTGLGSCIMRRGGEEEGR